MAYKDLWAQTVGLGRGAIQAGRAGWLGVEGEHLVAKGRKAQWRPCRLKTAPLRDAADWVERYFRIWEERFGQLDRYLIQLQEKEKRHGRKV